eukprot:g1353.t1
MAATPKQIAEGFLKAYYPMLDSPKRVGMANLYHADATMNFAGKTFVGKEQIQAKFNSLGSTATGTAAAIAHDIKSFDAAWGPVPNQTVLIVVTGNIKIDNDNALQFCQALQLVNKGGNWALCNDMFQFVYGI